MLSAVRIVNQLWTQAEKLVEPPQFCFILACDPRGEGGLVFRHNSLSNEALSTTLREFADKLDAGEARFAAHLTVVPDQPDGAG